MGFAAGLGSGFQKAFLQRQELDAVAERDEFKIAYDSYVNQKTKRDADKSKHETMVKSAKSITQSLGGLGVDPAAWTYAYDWLEAGYSVADVEKKLTTTKFANIPAAAPPQAASVGAGAMGTMSPAMMPNNGQPPVSVPQQGPASEMEGGAMGSPSMQPMDMNDTGPDLPNVNIQTQSDFARSMDPTLTQAPPPEVTAGGGMGAGAAPTPMNPIEQIGSTIQGKFAEIGNPQLKAENARNAANQRVQGALGISPEEFNQTMGGFSADPIEHTLQIAQGSPASATVLEEYDLLDSGLTPAAVSRAVVQATEDARSGDPSRLAKAARFKALLPDIMLSMDAMKSDSADPAEQANRIKVYDTLKDLAAPIREPRLKIGEAIASVETMDDLTQKMGQIVEEYGSVNTAGAQLLTNLDALKTNVGSVVDVLNTALTQGAGLPSEDTIWQQFEQGMEAALPGWGETAEAERNFSAMVIQFAYSYAKVQLGQSGTGQSDRDINRTMQIVLNSNNPEQIINNFKRLVVEGATSTNNSIEQLRNSYEFGLMVEAEQELKGSNTFEQSLQPMKIPEYAASETPKNIDTNLLGNPDSASKPPTGASTSYKQGVMNAEAAKLAGVPEGTEYRRYTDGRIAIKGVDY